MTRAIAAIAFAAATLAAPAAGLAQGCHHEEKVKMTCAEGQSTDPKTGVCVPVVGS